MRQTQHSLVSHEKHACCDLTMIYIYENDCSFSCRGGLCAATLTLLAMLIYAREPTFLAFHEWASIVHSTLTLGKRWHQCLHHCSLSCTVHLICHRRCLSSLTTLQLLDKGRGLHGTVQGKQSANWRKGGGLQEVCPPVLPFSTEGVNIKAVSTGLHHDDKLDWSANTDALNKNSQGRLYSLP